MYDQAIKASPNHCTKRLKFMTSLQLWQQLEVHSDCSLDFLVMNMARGWLTSFLSGSSFIKYEESHHTINIINYLNTHAFKYPLWANAYLFFNHCSRPALHCKESRWNWESFMPHYYLINSHEVHEYKNLESITLSEVKVRGPHFP